jgi:hypothetical protein
VFFKPTSTPQDARRPYASSEAAKEAHRNQDEDKVADTTIGPHLSISAYADGTAVDKLRGASSPRANVR